MPMFLRDARRLKKKQTNSWHLCGAWFDLDTWADSMISMLFHGFPFFLACRFDPVSVPLSILFFFSCYFFSLILIFLWCFFSWKHVSFFMCFTCFFLELSWFCEGYEVFRSNLVKRIANFFYEFDCSVFSWVQSSHVVSTVFDSMSW